MSIRSSIQGYVRNNNLSESLLDRDALNNLGGSPIADDIALFANNLKNESIISIRKDEYDSTTGFFTIVNTTTEEINKRASVFTDGDVVSLIDENGDILGENLYITDSNTIDEFRLSSKKNSSDAGDIINVGDLSQYEDNYVLSIIRSDAVSSINILMLSEQKARSVSYNNSNDDSQLRNNNDDIFNVGNLEDEFSSINFIVDYSEFESKRKYRKDVSILTDYNLEIDGSVGITDPSDTISQEGFSESSPGLYISNPDSNPEDVDITRAFSSNYNSWSDNGQGALTTESRNVTVGSLIYNNGVQIDGLPDNTVDKSINLNFSHKMNVVIDGISYNLCLTT